MKVDNAKFYALEEKIMDCWTVVDALRDLSTYNMEYGYDEDKVNNILVGIEQLYQMKFEMLRDQFEQCIKQ